MFNIKRLEIARKRRRYTYKALAEQAGIAPVTLSRVVNGKQLPEQETIDGLVRALGFPESFFVCDDLDEIDGSAVSFRSLSSMTARERDAALSAGSLAFEISDWLNDKYHLPNPDLLDLREEQDAESAARVLRQHWGLGERPIGNLIKILEAKGIRVFSLSETTKTIDAFSLWRNDEPFVFLNSFKSAERSRFDAAHELGHLVLHKHGGAGSGDRASRTADPRKAEIEADNFASAFLMPANDIQARLPNVRTLNKVIAEKSRWKVSAAALCVRLNRLGLISDWHYRTFNIQLNQRFRGEEPNSIEREKSELWTIVFEDLWRKRKSRASIAKELHIPEGELDNLVFGLTSDPTDGSDVGKRNQLRLVTSTD
ncbi:MAG: ImmA/IrrE family metallo-endopeptidase [Alphaproteobacteria bacterium]|nr:MAG: ImmA/IrrE family metallo-endopeptidase [Alphaproteobacteria bacterium]